MVAKIRKEVEVYSAAFSGSATCASTVSFDSAGAALLSPPVGSASDDVQRVYVFVLVLGLAFSRSFKRTRLSLKSCIMRVESL